MLLFLCELVEAVQYYFFPSAVFLGPLFFPLMFSMKPSKTANCDTLCCYKIPRKYIDVCSCSLTKYEKQCVQKLAVVVFLRLYCFFLFVFLQKLSVVCEECQEGERKAIFQRRLHEVYSTMDKFVKISFQTVERHIFPDAEPAVSLETIRELENVLTELLRQYNTQASGESRY